MKRGALGLCARAGSVPTGLMLAILVDAAGAASVDGKEWSTPGLLFVSGAAALLLAGLLFAYGHAMAVRGRSMSAVAPRKSKSGATEETSLRGIFNSTQESIVIIDEQGVLEHVSPATAQMLGYRIDELIGKPLTTLMHVSDDARDNGSLERYLKTGRPGVIANIRELNARRCDGTSFPVELGLVEQHIEGRKRFVGTVRDVTQTRLTHALLRAETRIATVLSHAHSVDEVAGDIVGALCSLGFEYGQWVVCTPITREWQVSARHQSRPLSAEYIDALGVGVAGSDAQGTAMRAWQSSQVIWCTHLENDPHNPRAAAAVTAGLRAYAVLPVRSSGEAVAVIELFSTAADPRSPTLESALSNIALQVGQLVSRLQAEQQLHTIIRTVPSAVFQARQGERRTIALSFISAKIESLWGVPPEGVIAHSRRALWKVPRAYRRQLLQGLSEAITQSEGWDVTVPVKIDQSHGHDVRWLRIHAAPGHEYGDTPVWDGIISDVTEQKLAEQQVVLLNLDLERRVEERTQELAGLNTELEAFADAVSHDLRAPLRGMSGYAQMLQARTTELPEDMGGLVEKILAQGEHMEQLIAA
ncbi:MAG: PAS domain S-box protein, partial [Pseudomonadota bacterium]